MHSAHCNLTFTESSNPIYFSGKVCRKLDGNGSRILELDKRILSYRAHQIEVLILVLGKQTLSITGIVTCNDDTVCSESFIHGTDCIYHCTCTYIKRDVCTGSVCSLGNCERDDSIGSYANILLGDGDLADRLKDIGRSGSGIVLCECTHIE